MSKRKEPKKIAQQENQAPADPFDIGLNKFSTDLGLDLNNDQAAEIIDDEGEFNQETRTKRRSTECLVRTDRHLYRRAFSETQLMDVAGLNFQPGESYHFITAGDADSLSYLKLILRQQKLEYVLFSTWCMAAEDILQFDEWIEDGKIKKVDAYVGEIFPRSYSIEYAMLKKTIAKCGGRIAVFRNHSKIYAGYGAKFAFGIETSANINTNPRAENGCITIGQEIYEFYKSYFDKIISFDGGRK